jgi:mannose-1-phosphate guanylyltransferase/phosphomannomutase
MEYTIELLAKHGIKDVVVLLYHQPHIIKNYFGDGKKFGVNISYVEAPENYGTAGAVKYAAKGLNDPFLVISADLITDFNLGEIVDYHKNKKAALTIVLTRVENPLPYGIVITSKDGKIKHFLEKPSWSEVFSDTVNTGIYVVEPKILDMIPAEKEYDFSHNLFPKLLENKEKMYGMVVEGLWKDIGKNHTLFQRGSYLRSSAQLHRSRYSLYQKKLPTKKAFPENV